jgi:predicted RNase H-like HicB family nuclease
MIKYAIIIEKASDGGYGAYAPDLPGCIGMGANKEEAIENMKEAIYFHLEGLKKEGLPIPEPNAEAENLVLKI